MRFIFVGLVNKYFPFTEIKVGFASSSNGGANWNIIEDAFPMNGIVGILAEKQNIRVNGLTKNCG